MKEGRKTCEKKHHIKIHIFYWVKFLIEKISRQCRFCQITKLQRQKFFLWSVNGTQRFNWNFWYIFLWFYIFVGKFLWKMEKKSLLFILKSLHFCVLSTFFGLVSFHITWNDELFFVNSLIMFWLWILWSGKFSG